MAVATPSHRALAGRPDLGGRPAAEAPAGPAEAAAGRVVIVSASVGAGHDGAAAELERQLRVAGMVVDRYDFLDILPGAWGRLVRGGYHAQLTVAPRTWGWLLGAAGSGTTSTRVARMLARVAGGRMMAAIGPDPSLVLSTYPLASQLIGRLRQDGRLTAPAATFLTDMSVHPLWVAPGIDAHLALHRVPAAQAGAYGARQVVVAGAAVGPAFRPRRDAVERVGARMAFGLPQGTPLALVVAGSWGVGSVGRSARDIADTGRAVPVVVCGRNERLRRRLARDPRVIALGWIDDMATLMRACDVVVQNAGGLTSLESLASHLPVVTYRCLPGHGETNAAALEQAGWADWVRDRRDLADALSRAVAGRPSPDVRRVHAVSTIMALAAGARRYGDRPAPSYEHGSAAANGAPTSGRPGGTTT